MSQLFSAQDIQRSCRLEQAKYQPTGQHYPISQEKAAYITLGKNATDG